VNLDKESEITSVDANSYSAFKVVDSLIVKKITDELEALGEPEEEGRVLKTHPYSLLTYSLHSPLCAGRSACESFEL
jgi:hypothetical protein